ncbi:MAG: hypothetical protein V8R00_03955 [Coprococcus catus]
MVKKETINDDKLVKKSTVYADKKNILHYRKIFFYQVKNKNQAKSRDCEHFNEID